MDKIDVAIIGGGVIGLAVAAAVAGDDRDVFVFERNASFGQEISSRNSEVIHSGVYYPYGSLKEKTCIEGNGLLYEICAKGNIPHKKTGKLIVARDSLDIKPLEDLFNMGSNKGLEGIMMLSPEQVKRMEPNVQAVQAVFLPMTGIIDSHSLMEYFLAEARSAGGDIIYDSEIVKIEKKNGFYELTALSETGEDSSFQAAVVVNAAGLESDTVAAIAGIDIHDYRLCYNKGDYFRIGNKKNVLVKRPVYPVARPDDPSLGIHLTPDLAGGARLGPDDEYLNTRHIDYNVDPHKAGAFHESVKAFLPFLEKGDLSVDTSGIRPKLQGPGQPFRDFVIKHEDESGFPGLINLVGIESPGLTAAPSIARLVKKMVDALI